MTLLFRKLKHRDDLERQNSSRGLDRFHEVCAKLGFNRQLLHAVAEFDDIDPTRTEMRIFEYKAFLLLDPSENTQHQQIGLHEHRFVQ